MKVRLVSGAHFSAAHRLYRPDWDDERNQRVFDKCNNPSGHGHTYELAGKVSPGRLVRVTLAETARNKVVYEGEAR